MDRRLFLRGMIGLAGAMGMAAIARPELTEAGIPNGTGILDELNTSSPDFSDEIMTAQPELVDSRGRHSRHRSRHPGYRRHSYRPRRRHRRQVWQRVCERYRYHGHWRRRCYRRRVWVYM